MFGISKLSIIPIRQSASDKSEMISQLLFGEIYTIIEESEKWVKIESHGDGYQGWIDKFQHVSISRENFEEIASSKIFLTTTVLQNVYYENKNFPITIGSSLPFFEKVNNENVFFLNNEKWKTDISPLEISGKKDFKFIKNIALKYLNSPYLWGGRSIFGIDCSGFTQQVYRFAGYNLQRDSGNQANQGLKVHFEERQRGDVVFFQNDGGEIVHVGILLENDEIIHSSSKVRIDLLDAKGIWCIERKLYSHIYHSIKRIIV